MFFVIQRLDLCKKVTGPRKTGFRCLKLLILCYRSSSNPKKSIYKIKNSNTFNHFKLIWTLHCYGVQHIYKHVIVAFATLMQQSKALRIWYAGEGFVFENAQHTKGFILRNDANSFLEHLGQSVFNRLGSNTCLITNKRFSGVLLLI